MKNKTNVLAQIPVTVGVILGFVVVAIVLAYLLVPKAYEGVVILVAAALAAAGTLGNAYYVGRTLELTVQSENRILARQEELNRQAAERHEQDARQARLERSSRFGERWNQPELFHSRKACRQVMDDAPKGADHIAKLLEEDLDMAMNIGHVLNFLEEMSISIREEWADEEFCRRLFEGIALKLFDATETWRQQQAQRRGRTKLWAELRWLYNRWS